MGKASKFFKALFGFKTIEPTEPPPSRSDLNKQPKRHWSFIKSHRDKPSHHHLSNAFDASLSRPFDTPLHHHVSVETGGDVDGATTGSSNHAIAVAAATAAVAEAAVAAAHAAAEVVRMTSRTTAGYGLRAEWAAVKIQSYFRSYLARKALRALKGLVKLQALVRGHILRKQAADDLRRLQALQALLQARATRLHSSPQPTTKKSSSYNHHHGPPTPEKCEHVLRSRTTKHNHPSPLKNHGSRSFNDERNEKILEMDTTKPHVIQQQQPRRRNLFQPDHISYSHSQSLTTSRGSSIQPPGPSPSESCEINSLTAPLKCPINDIDEETPFCTAQNSPPFYGLSFKGNLSMRVGQFTPAKSDSSRSCLSGYSDHPNYMAYTESSRAKVRSLSAPRQRPPLELPKRYSMYGCGSGGQRGSNLRDSFVNKAYPGSGRLDRLGMPVGGMVVRESEFSGSYWN